MEAGEPRSSRATAVILSLGYKQMSAVKAVASERHLPYLEAAEYVTKNRHDVNMPAAGWRALTKPLSDRAFTARQEWSSKHEGAGGALRTIVSNLQALEAHPAFSGQAVVDPTVRSFRMVVGFHAPTFFPEFSPYPSPHHDDPAVWVFVPEPTIFEVDLGAGPVEVEGVRWLRRSPTAADIHAGLFIDPAEHVGWSTPPG